jgi:bleomycin hydrolase
MKNYLIAVISCVFILVSISAFAKDKKDKKKGYEFKMIKEIPTTPVKNQSRSGTCWSFSLMGFFEAELLKMNKDTFDLSEMFLVRNCYSAKTKKYVRFHGHLNLSGGGGFSDGPWVLKEFGLVPESAYSGLVIGEDHHRHGEMDIIIKSIADAVIQNKNRKLSPVWHNSINHILDDYLGKYPDKFEYSGKEYTPKTFADELALNPDDYIELSSFTHHPFYKGFVVEVPDNWMYSKAYNLPLDELMETLVYAIKKGYTFCWGGDVSNKGFSWKNGLAIVPDKELKDLSGSEKEKWEPLTKKEKEKALFKFDKPVPEVNVTQEIRQQAYDNYSNTDDHGMLISGLLKDQNGNKYFLVKNSWGIGEHKYKGFLHMSFDYVKLNTISIMINKKALPPSIKKKLGL